MAFLLTHFWPGRDRGAIPHDDRHGASPEGAARMARSITPAGPTEGGMLIAAVWDSKESADRFVHDVLLASMPVEGGFEGHPEERAAEVSNLLAQ